MPFRPVVLKARVSANLERQRVRFAAQTQKDIMKYEREVQIGRQIQLDFLPKSLPQPQGWEIAAHFEPAGEVAGDFYDAYSLSNHLVSLVMGDVSDRGITSALYMALFRSLLRAFTQPDYAERMFGGADDVSKVSPSHEQVGTLSSASRLMLKNALELTNNFILNNHASTNMFSAVFYGILDPESGMLMYINAGLEPPLILNQGKVKARLQPTGLAVGMLPDVEYEIQQTRLDPGDTLLIYTDGVTAAKNPSGQSFGKQGLLDLLETPDLSATALLNRIDGVLRAHLAEAARLDDITTLAVRRSD